jgi:hypothetical protein
LALAAVDGTLRRDAVFDWPLPFLGAALFVFRDLMERVDIVWAPFAASELTLARPKALQIAGRARANFQTMTLPGATSRDEVTKTFRKVQVRDRSQNDSQ